MEERRQEHRAGCPNLCILWLAGVVVNYAECYSAYSGDPRSFSRFAHSRVHSSCSGSIHLLRQTTVCISDVRSDQWELIRLPISIALEEMAPPVEIRRKLVRTMSHNPSDTRSIPSATRICL